MLIFYRMLRIVKLKCLTKGHVNVKKSGLHGVNCAFTNSALALILNSSFLYFLLFFAPPPPQLLFFPLSVERSVMLMMIIPLPHYDNLGGGGEGKKRGGGKCIRVPHSPPSYFFTAGAAVAKHFATLSKHPGAAPGFITVQWITSNGINFIKEDEAGLLSSCHLKQLSHHTRTLMERELGKF